MMPASCICTTCCRPFNRFEEIEFDASMRGEKQRFLSAAMRILYDSRRRPRKQRFQDLFRLCETVSQPVAAAAHMLLMYNYVESWDKDGDSGFRAHIKSAASRLDLNGNILNEHQGTSRQPTAANIGRGCHTVLLVKRLFETYNKCLEKEGSRLRLTLTEVVGITHVDHVLPSARRGEDEASNFILLPRDLNIRMGATLPDEGTAKAVLVGPDWYGSDHLPSAFSFASDAIAQAAGCLQQQPTHAMVDVNYCLKLFQPETELHYLC